MYYSFLCLKWHTVISGTNFWVYMCECFFFVCLFDWYIGFRNTLVPICSNPGCAQEHFSFWIVTYRAYIYHAAQLCIFAWLQQILRKTASIYRVVQKKETRLKRYNSINNWYFLFIFGAFVAEEMPLMKWKLESMCEL